MSRIDSLSQVMETLRRQLAESAKKLDRGTKAPAKSDASSTPEAVPRVSAQDLQKRVRERLQALGDGAGYRQKATRVFLESILTSEFGDDLVHDMRFAEMLNEIDKALQADPELKSRMHALFDQMKKQS